MNKILASLVLLFPLFPAITNGQTTISTDLACSAETSCKNNNATLITIGSQACNEEEACSYNSGETLTVGDGACNSADAISGGVWAGPQGGGKTCSFNTANLIVGNLGCTGVASCAYNQQALTTGPGPRVCTGQNSCSNNTATLTALQDSCKGTGSCSENGPSSQDGKASIMVQSNSCYGEQSCRGGKGRADLSGCQGDNSCQEWSVGSSFTTSASSCSGVNSCQKLSAATDFIIGEGSCTGANSCRNIAAANNLTIGDNSCTGENSCNNCPSDSVADNQEDCPGGSPGEATPDSPSTNTAPAPSPNGSGSSNASLGRVVMGSWAVVWSLVLMCVGTIDI